MRLTLGSTRNIFHIAGVKRQERLSALHPLTQVGLSDLRTKVARKRARGSVKTPGANRAAGTQTLFEMTIFGKRMGREPRARLAE